MKKDEKSRRIRERLRLTIPVRVRGRDSATHEWSEMSRLLDLTPFGARLSLSHPTEPGRLLHVTMAMPRSMRCFDHAEDQYRVWSLVRNVKLLEPSAKSRGLLEAGVAFVGKYPPASFQSDPTLRFEIARAHSESGLWEVREDPVAELPRSDNRGETRYTIPVEVSIEIFGEEGAAPVSEKTVTEDISRTGAKVFTSLNIEPGRFVKVTSEHYDVRAIAAVRARRVGPDGIVRLHLEFVGSEWPLAGIE